MCLGMSQSLTFHQDDEDVSHDGEGGAQDKYGEQEGADGVGDLIFWLKIKETRHKKKQLTEGYVLSDMLKIIFQTIFNKHAS